ncbi:nucleic acid dioxygenase ALKBH1 [Parasteatoda tepidariorum]|uniref:nucleic acid dioxygenase ALKBH1 n=1 Tax=Parasteatoda tepidariorum TaxID=114398 RepID=UPI00077FDCC2|nr:nucleic acid dioxygenase ALKBH1 [Parasteatoda tepidariorum]
MTERDCFKEEFKYYKRKIPPPQYGKVIDFDADILNLSVTKTNNFFDSKINSECCILCQDLGLKDHKSWESYSLKDHKGFLYLKNPFFIKGQQTWIRKCLELYPRKPSVTNLDLHHSNIDDIWSLSQGSNLIEKSYLSKLCWTTLGYHHNWDTKIYNPDHKSDFPKCLKQLSEHVAECLGFKNYNPEAAIVNYYNMKSSLGIHNDHSEENVHAPIISFSFGQTGIFLIGALNKFKVPTAIFLRSGDIVIMSGESRLAFHAVPCIIQEDTTFRYYDSEDKEWSPFKNYIDKSRLNISVRQVYVEKTVSR